MDNEWRVLQQIDTNKHQNTHHSLDSLKCDPKSSAAVQSAASASGITSALVPSSQSGVGVAAGPQTGTHGGVGLGSFSPALKKRTSDTPVAAGSLSSNCTPEKKATGAVFINKLREDDHLESSRLGEANESSGSSELGSGVASPNSSIYLSTTASPNHVGTKYCTVSSTDSSSLYYSVCGDSLNSLLDDSFVSAPRHASSGAESDASFDATVVLGEAEEHLISGSEQEPLTLTGSSDLLAVIPELATPVNKHLLVGKSSIGSSGGSSAGNSGGNRRYFDNTFANDCTSVFCNEGEQTLTLSASKRHSENLLESQQASELEFRSADQVDFNSVPAFDSPLRRPTFSLGIPSARLPVKEPLLLPQRSQSTSDSCQTLTKSGRQLLLSNETQNVIEEFESPLANKKGKEDLDSSFLGQSVFEETGINTEDSVHNKTFDCDLENQDSTVLLPFLQPNNSSAHPEAKIVDNDSSTVSILDTTLEASLELQKDEKMSTVYEQDDFDFEAIADPFKSSNKMMADSPPLPRRNADIDYDDIDFDAIENPFASGNKMMQNTPPDEAPAPITKFSNNNVESLPTADMSSTPGNADTLPEMNGTATITRPSAHAKTKTRVPPHKAKRSANTRLSTESELAAKLTTSSGGAGDAASTGVSADEQQESLSTIDESRDSTPKKVPPPVPKRGSSQAATVNSQDNSSKQTLSSATLPINRSDNQLVDPSAVVTSTVQVEQTSVAPAASSSGDASFVTDTDQSNSSYSIIQDQNNNANTAACNNISSSLNHEEDFPPPPSEEELKQNGSGNKIQSTQPSESITQSTEDVQNGAINSSTAEPEEPKTTVYEQDDFDFESVADPFKSSSKMMAESPPLPRKKVEIDYDNIDFDAIENPFASSNKMMMGTSPPVGNAAPIATLNKFDDGFANQIAAADTTTNEADAENEKQLSAASNDNESAEQNDSQWQVKQTPTSSLEVAKSLKSKLSASASTPASVAAVESKQKEEDSSSSDQQQQQQKSTPAVVKTIRKPKAKRVLNQQESPVKKSEKDISQENQENNQEAVNGSVSTSEISAITNHLDHLTAEVINSSVKQTSAASAFGAKADLPVDVKEDFFKEFECLRDENTQMKEELSKYTEEAAVTTVVLHDLEDAFSQLCVIKDKAMGDLQKEINRLSQENEEYQNDLQSLEQSFDQALKRYNKARDAIGQYKNNEVVLKQELQKAHQKIVDEEKMYATLKTYTEERFTEAEQQVQENERALKGTITRLEMELKRLKMANDALQLSYERKVKDNKEMNELCENLISKLAERENYD